MSYLPHSNYYQTIFPSVEITLMCNITETRGYTSYLSLICTFYNDTFGYHILVSEGSSNMHIEIITKPTSLAAYTWTSNKLAVTLVLCQAVCYITTKQQREHWDTTKSVMQMMLVVMCECVTFSSGLTNLSTWSYNFTHKHTHINCWIIKVP
jgi:hypothetical protein